MLKKGKYRKEKREATGKFVEEQRTWKCWNSVK
jgi:hypothetical protein